MNSKIVSRRVAEVLVLLCGLMFVVSGCANKAQEQAKSAIAKAESDLNVAKEAMADKYAVAAFKNAESSLTDAKDAFEKKNFQQAVVYAEDSSEKAISAARESGERSRAEKKGPVQEKPKRAPRTLK